jgi:hypothetical protein
MIGQTSLLAAVAALALTLGSPLRISDQATAGDRAGIVGSWRVVSYQLEFQDGSQPTYPLGMRPNGYLMFGADGRMMAYLEADERKAPQTDAERSAAYRTLIAYTGKYRVQGDKWVTKVDGAWNVQWVGTEQERSFSLSGNRLQVVSQWNRNALYGGKVTRGHLMFEREK